MGAEFLGRIPMEVKTRLAGDMGRPVVLNSPKSKTAEAFVDIAKNVEDFVL